MIMNPIQVCSSSNALSRSTSGSASSSCSDTSFMDASDCSTLSYKHQPLPKEPQHHVIESIRDCPVDAGEKPQTTAATTTLKTSSSSSNPVFDQVMNDLRRARKLHGENDSCVADAWNALGLVRIHMQRDAQGARCCHEHALRIFQSQKMAQETAITLMDLGHCCERLERREEAVEKYQQALDILQAEKVPETHPQVMSTKRAMSRMMRR